MIEIIILIIAMFILWMYISSENEYERTLIIAFMFILAFVSSVYKGGLS